MESQSEVEDTAPGRSHPDRPDVLDDILASANALSEADHAGATAVIERAVRAHMMAAQMRLVEECVSKAVKISKATLRAFTDHNLNTVDGFGHISTAERAAE